MGKAIVFYRRHGLTDISTPLDTGEFRLMDRTVVDAFLAMPERDRFVRGMVAWTGFRQEPVHYRRAGRSIWSRNGWGSRLLAGGRCGTIVRMSNGAVR